METLGKVLNCVVPVVTLAFAVVAAALATPNKRRWWIIVAGIITVIVVGVNSWGVQARSDAAIAERRAIRVDLAALMEEGQALWRRCLNESEPPPNEEANQWDRRTADYLRTRLDESYVVRFRSDSGLLPLSATGIQSAPHRGLADGLHIRLTRLNQFTGELAE